MWILYCSFLPDRFSFFPSACSKDQFEPNCTAIKGDKWGEYYRTYGGKWRKSIPTSFKLQSLVCSPRASTIYSTASYRCMFLDVYTPMDLKFTDEDNLGMPLHQKTTLLLTSEQQLILLADLSYGILLLIAKSDVSKINWPSLTMLQWVSGMLQNKVLIFKGKVGKMYIEECPTSACMAGWFSTCALPDVLRAI